MKKLLMLAAVMLAGPAWAQGIGGVWKTQPNDEGNFAHVEFRQCGSNYCGKMIKSFDASGSVMNSENDGKDIVWDMQDAGSGQFKNGRIWDPGADKKYRSKMQVNGATLKVSGCIGPICRGQTWKKVK